MLCRMSVAENEAVTRNRSSGKYASCWQTATRDHAAGTECEFYGKDPFEQPLTFAQLLQNQRYPRQIRDSVYVVHPDATPELLDTILQCSKVGHHLHLPVQGGSNDVLRRATGNTVEKYMESVNYLRRRDRIFL